jgi:hypothetical protein
MYGEAVDDEKLRLLAFEDRWHFVALLCLKSQGVLEERNPDLRRRKICVKLGLDSVELETVMKRLVTVGLVSPTYEPIAWNKRQFISDSSTNRVRAFRKRFRNTAVTPSESESEQRQSQNRAEKTRNSVGFQPDAGPVERIFVHWKTEYGHPRAALDAKRRRVIEAALKIHDEATLCAAISGYRNSPHHMGENERRTVYDDVELFLRDATHIENGLRFSRGPPAPAMSTMEKAKAKLAERMHAHERVVSEQSGESDSALGQITRDLR